MKITTRVYTDLVLHAMRDAPNEACGLVGITDGIVRKMAAATNVARNPRNTFSISAQEHYDLSNTIFFDCYELGVYHSHPRGPATLSTTDLWAPGPHETYWLHLLIDLDGADPNYIPAKPTKIHVFRISSAGAEEEELEIIDTLVGRNTQ